MKIVPLPPSKPNSIALSAIANGTVFSGAFYNTQGTWYRASGGIINLQNHVFYATFANDAITNVVLYPDAELHLNGK